MDKYRIVLSACMLIALAANSQITKGNWMIGGSASFSSQNHSSTAFTQFKQTDIQINPVASYFFIDKFTAGLRPSFTYGSNTVGNANTIIGIGPFARYYFLSPDNILNIFTEGSYSYGNIFGNSGQTSSKSNTYSILAGPVVYFNTSVGLEFSLAYSTTKIVGFTGKNNEIRFGIGFQFYLEREKQR